MLRTSLLPRDPVILWEKQARFTGKYILTSKQLVRRFRRANLEYHQRRDGCKSCETITDGNLCGPGQKLMLEANVGLYRGNKFWILIIRDWFTSCWRQPSTLPSIACFFFRSFARKEWIQLKIDVVDVSFVRMVCFFDDTGKFNNKEKAESSGTCELLFLLFHRGSYVMVKIFFSSF